MCIYLSVTNNSVYYIADLCYIPVTVSRVHIMWSITIICIILLTHILNRFCLLIKFLFQMRYSMNAF